MLQANDCKPAQPVAALQVHGDADSVIANWGGRRDAAYPGAEATVRDWAVRNCCDREPVPGPNHDLAVSADVEAPGTSPLAGSETTTIRRGHPPAAAGG